jgi:hypothetical protein
MSTRCLNTGCNHQEDGECTNWTPCNGGMSGERCPYCGKEMNIEESHEDVCHQCEDRIAKEQS